MQHEPFAEGEGLGWVWNSHNEHPPAPTPPCPPHPTRGREVFSCHCLLRIGETLPSGDPSLANVLLSSRQTRAATKALLFIPLCLKFGSPGHEANIIHFSA